MKKVTLGIVSALILFAGCKISNFVSVKEELKNFTTKGNLIVYKGEPFAQLQAITYTIESGELIKEMNFKLIEKEDLSKVETMIYFLSKTHEEEVEVEINVDDKTPFKL